MVDAVTHAVSAARAVQFVSDRLHRRRVFRSGCSDRSQSERFAGPGCGSRPASETGRVLYNHAAGLVSAVVGRIAFALNFVALIAAYAFGWAVLNDAVGHIRMGLAGPEGG